jgi:hypothetical protein
MSTVKRVEANGVPPFEDEREAAAFWDTHSPLDYPEEFQEVTVAVNRPAERHRLAIGLSERAMEQLENIAGDRGVSASALARGWILEHLREYEDSKAP